MPIPNYPNPHRRLLKIYNLLYKVYGPRRWWPADGAFEVCVGAILTQNTNWSNVEKAISALKKQKVLSPLAIKKMDSRRLARLIRPCGYYNVKAKRLKSFISFLYKSHGGNLAGMQGLKPRQMREILLGIKGIGPETADSILLYALKKPIFVVDAYTRRLFTCQGLVDDSLGYDEIQSMFMENLPTGSRLFNEYHALIVEHAKRVCKARPRCSHCVLRPKAGKSYKEDSSHEARTHG
ncbi:MAG: endonuclease III domain-containing protein [Candidatus Omnitrophica bacterium]|nr:endonuclease III domain-containing protein [Candidatus Omnitrophota bacterium]